jgi:hypothetical protein
MYNGKELHEVLGPKYGTVLLWSTPLNAGGGGGQSAAGARGGAAGGQGAAGAGVLQPLARARSRPGRSRSTLHLARVAPPAVPANAAPAAAGAETGSRTAASLPSSPWWPARTV